MTLCFEFYGYHHQVKDIPKNQHYFLKWFRLTFDEILEICQCLSCFGWNMRLWKGCIRLTIITKNNNFVKEIIQGDDNESENNYYESISSDDSDADEKLKPYEYSEYTFIPAAKIPDCVEDVVVYKFNVYNNV